MEEPNETLFLTPRKVETATEFRPGVGVAKEVGERASAKVAEESHRTPQPRQFHAAAVANRKERVIVVQNVVCNKLWGGGPSDDGRRLAGLWLAHRFNQSNV